MLRKPNNAHHFLSVGLDDFDELEEDDEDEKTATSDMSEEHVTVISTGEADSPPELMQTSTSTSSSGKSGRVNIIRINSEENFESYGDNEDFESDLDSKSPTSPRSMAAESYQQQKDFMGRNSWMRSSLRKSPGGGNRTSTPRRWGSLRM